MFTGQLATSFCLSRLVFSYGFISDLEVWGELCVCVTMCACHPLALYTHNGWSHHSSLESVGHSNYILYMKVEGLILKA